MAENTLRMWIPSFTGYQFHSQRVPSEAADIMKLPFTDGEENILAEKTMRRGLRVVVIVI